MDALKDLTLPQAILLGVLVVCWTVFVIARGMRE